MEKNKQSKLMIGVIGLGRFGSLLAKQLKVNLSNAELVAFDSHKVTPIKGVRILPLEEVAKSDIIFVCVPISSFETVIFDLKKHLRKGTTVIDVCSVKVHPTNIMQKLLPDDVCLIATHPLFGPDSAVNGIKGHKIVVWPVRKHKKAKIISKLIFDKCGLEIITINPHEHDKLMAISQGFTHLIGRIANNIGVGETILDTKSFEQLLAVQKVVTSDSEQLFLDMQKFNPFAKKMRMNVKKALNDIEKNILIQ